MPFLAFVRKIAYGTDLTQRRKDAKEWSRLNIAALAVVFEPRKEEAGGGDEAVERQAVVGEPLAADPGHENCHGEICRRLKIEGARENPRFDDEYHRAHQRQHG